MKSLITIPCLLWLFLASNVSLAEQAPREQLKIAVQALPNEAFTSIDGGCWAAVPHHFYTFPGDHEITVGMPGFGIARVPVALTNRDMHVDVRLKRKRGHFTGLSLLSLGASAVLPGLVLTVIGGAKQDTQDNLINIGAPILGVGAAFALTGGLLIRFGRERPPDISVTPLIDLGTFTP